MKILNKYSLRAKNRTEAAAMNGGMEIGLTVLVFVLLGVAIDNWLGTKPAFVIGMFLFAAIGSGLRYYYIYTADMERLEAERAAALAARASTKSSLSPATKKTATKTPATKSTATRSKAATPATITPATITTGSTARAADVGSGSPADVPCDRTAAVDDADIASARRKVSA